MLHYHGANHLSNWWQIVLLQSIWLTITEAAKVERISSEELLKKPHLSSSTRGEGLASRCGTIGRGKLANTF